MAMPMSMAKGETREEEKENREEERMEEDGDTSCLKKISQGEGEGRGE